ncbi:hypothetical protein HII36_48295 [Nonomuraea sp. NN258]|uniref:hypothetical protein n=1 Tax=Nonomuraea antri TaxID=2730852 RepID=UPI001568B6BC|nr:hypothetical protein [Nonomuraea antri]NRQ39580.1 hypothetical protein [Nonomuraea antri]
MLSPVKIGIRRNQRTPGVSSATAATPPSLRTASGPLYRLADYLDQHGRHDRADQIPPIDFWTAAAAHAHPADLAALGNAARARGLYRDAAQLYKHATTHGDLNASANLVNLMHALHPADHRPAHHAARYAAVNDPYTVGRLLDSLWEAGAEDQLRELAGRAARHTPVDGPYAVSQLLDSLREAGAKDQLRELVERVFAAGLFVQFVKFEEGGEFRFGHEPNGNAAAPWAWDDLE